MPRPHNMAGEAASISPYHLPLVTLPFLLPSPLPLHLSPLPFPYTPPFSPSYTLLPSPFPYSPPISPSPSPLCLSQTPFGRPAPPVDSERDFIPKAPFSSPSLYFSLSSLAFLSPFAFFSCFSLRWSFVLYLVPLHPIFLHPFSLSFFLPPFSTSLLLALLPSLSLILSLHTLPPLPPPPIRHPRYSLMILLKCGISGQMAARESLFPTHLRIWNCHSRPSDRKKGDAFAI